MSRRNTVVRSLHDLGLGVWFGGSLMGALGVNGATRDMALRDERLPVATDAWGRFTPVGAAAIGAHLAGALGLLRANRRRVRHQQGVAASSAAKAALTGVALGATGYAWYQGTQLGEAGSEAVAGGAVPSGETHPDVAARLQQMRVLQWVVPATTGGIVVLSALQGEQQRGDEQLRGFVGATSRQARKQLDSATKDARKQLDARAKDARKAAATAKKRGVKKTKAVLDH